MLRRKLGSAYLKVTGRTKKLIRPSLYDWTAIEVAFIVSTGRTGTKFLAKLLARAFEGVHACHEPRPDMYDVGLAFVRGEVSFEKAVTEVRDGRLHACAQVHRAGASRYVESNNNLAYLIPVIRHVFPECRIVHVVRDGRDCVRSSYSKKVPRHDQDGPAPLVMSPADPRRRMRACDLSDDPYREQWARMDRFERMCWYWAKKDGIIRQALLGDERAIAVKFEDIFDGQSNYKGLHDMIEFLGLKLKPGVTPDHLAEMMSRKSNRTMEYLLPHWTQWTPQQLKRFDEIAGRHMALSGYGT